MLTEAEENIVLTKARELCDTILAQPNMSVIRKNIDTFVADDKARGQYEIVMTKGQVLHEKQHKSLPLSGEEISDFERSREDMLANPVAKNFLEAQDALQHIQGTIQKLITKTLENGNVPTAEDLNESCGHGCGCHH